MERLQEDARRKVKAWMSPASYTVKPTTEVRKASELMRRHHVRHLLVVDRGALVGVVTDRDLRPPEHASDLWAVSAQYLLERDTKVEALMTASPTTVEHDAETGRAARLMVERRIGCLPVLRNQELVGIVTITDLLKALHYTIDPEAAWRAEVADDPS